MAAPSPRLRAAHRPIEAGTVLGGRYRLTRPIATGGMGDVWEASDDVLARSVAVKVLKPELVGAAGFLARFRAEARHAAPLGHPGIASVFDYGEEARAGGTVAYLVMELIPGETLSDLLDRHPVPPLPTTLSVLRQCAEALGAAHRCGVVHRDVKPANIMLLGDGAVKMTDFGIARAASAAPITVAGETVGTPHYMSPEQAMGTADITPAADVYSLGVVAYEMLTGRRPFERDHPMAVALAQVRDEPPPLPSWVPAGVADIVGRSLAKDPCERPADGLEVAAVVEGLERESERTIRTATVAMPTAASTRDAPPARTAAMPVLMPLDHPPRPGARRHAARIWWAALAAVLLVIGGAVAIASRQQRTDADVPVVTALPAVTLPSAAPPAAPPPPTAVAVATTAAPLEPPAAAEPPEPAEPDKGEGADKGKGNGKGNGKGKGG